MSGGNVGNPHETAAYNPDNDQYLVVWDTAVAQFDAVYGRRLSGSGVVTTTDTIVLSTQAADGDATPDLAYIPAAGQYQAVWTKGNFGFENGDIHGRVVYPDGSLGSVQTIAATSQHERGPRLTVDGSGALVIWQRMSGSGYDVYARPLDNNGLPSGDPFVIQETVGNQQNPAIASGDNRRYQLAWQDDRTGGWDLFTASLDRSYQVTHIQHEYDPLYRLVRADYNGDFNGEYRYAYDAVGNRTAYTTTIPGTTAVTYQYNAANQLIESVEVGSETTTYAWDDAGRLITTTVGVNVSRVYTYSQSGDLTAALVNGLLTTFIYDGDGRRLQMSAVGEVVTYTLDYARGFRVLLEEGGAFAETKHYLYGIECIAELVDADEPESEWRYYHQDGNHLVRQTTNMAATVTLAWTYSPEGAILLGEEGPVTHLGCEGNTTYDFSTGLIFKNGRYFDPNTGTWITLSGMVVWNSWQSRPGNGRQRKRSRKWLLLLFLFFIVLALVGCGGAPPTSTPDPIEIPCPPTATPGVPTVLPSNKMYAFVDSGVTLPGEGEPVSKSWETYQREAFDSDIDAIISRLIQSDRFGTITKLQAELGVSSSKPILLARVDAHNSEPKAAMGTFNPYIIVYDPYFLAANGQGEAFRRGLIVHEFAHLWDQNHGYQLSAGMQKFVNWGSGRPEMHPIVPERTLQKHLRFISTQNIDPRNTRIIYGQMIAYLTVAGLI